MSTDCKELCTEQLPELREMFERILCAARSSGGLAVGNIQLADRLIDAVVSWSEAGPARWRIGWRASHTLEMNND